MLKRILKTATLSLESLTCSMQKEIGLIVTERHSRKLISSAM